MPLDKKSVQDVGELFFNLAQSLLDDQHGIREGSIAILKDIQAELRPDLSAPLKRRWDGMLKKISSTEGRYFLPESS